VWGCLLRADNRRRLHSSANSFEIRCPRQTPRALPTWVPPSNIDPTGWDLRRQTPTFGRHCDVRSTLRRSVDTATLGPCDARSTTVDRWSSRGRVREATAAPPRLTNNLRDAVCWLMPRDAATARSFLAIDCLHDSQREYSRQCRRRPRRAFGPPSRTREKPSFRSEATVLALGLRSSHELVNTGTSLARPRGLPTVRTND
jgi:hypothetical protein